MIEKTDTEYYLRNKKIKENTLILSSMVGNIDVVSNLLKNGTDVNAKGDVSTVRSLLPHVGINATSFDGRTALMMVSICDEEPTDPELYQQEMRNRIKLIKLLCKYGADINTIVDDNGNTALELAQESALELAQDSNFQHMWNDIIILLKQCVIEQIIPKLKKRQKNQTKLGWMLRGIKVKNRGTRLPYDLEYYIRGFIG